MMKGAYPLQLDRTIKKMWSNEYAYAPTEWNRFAKVSDFGPGNAYSEGEISPIGGLVPMGENSPIPFDDVVEGHKKTWTLVKYGRGFAVTEEMLEDELFGKAKAGAKGLARSATLCAETAFWNLYNLGFSTALAWDGVAAFGTHTTMKGGNTLDNAVSADLSQTSLEAAFQYFDGLTDEAGLRVVLKPKALITGPSLRELAYGIKNATARLWAYTSLANGLVNTGDDIVAATALSADGVKNYLNPANGQVADWMPFVCHYLTDANSWFVVADEADARFMWKRKPSIKNEGDFNTETMLYKTTMRFSTGWGDYKGVYGSAGAS